MVKLNIVYRLGSKLNDIKYFKHLLPTDVRTVVEPFAGGFAVIKSFYVDTNRYKFHINDTDSNIFYVYKHYKYMIRLVIELDKIYESKYNHKGMVFYKYIENLDINKHAKEYILRTRFFRKQYRPLKSTDYSEEEANILDKAVITNYDYKVVMEKYKNDKAAFLFIDPPYLFIDNSGYEAQRKESDMTEIVVYLVDYIKTCKCRIMIIINKLKMLEELFKGYVKGEYVKLYPLSRKEAIHLIITNY